MTEPESQDHADSTTHPDTLDEVRHRLAEAEEVIAAIRDGTVDAFVVRREAHDRVYTLETADRPYRVLVESMQQGAMTVDADGLVLYANQRLADMLGAVRHTLAGRAATGLFEPGERQRFRALVRDALEHPVEGDTWMYAARGERLAVHLAASRVPLDGAPTVGVLVTDLTERRILEDLRRTEEERARAEAALRLADQRKDEFLAMLGHELRNPLAPMANALAILERSPAIADPLVSRAKAVLGRQLAHLVRLVDDLLDVSRVSRGKVQLQLAPCDLRAVVRQAVENGQGLVDERRHTLTLELPEEDVWVRGDFTRLVQVVSNLLNNAAKYTDPGGRLHIALDRIEPDQARIRVRDSGRGLDMATANGLFELFYQADRTLDRSEGGLGVGLALVKMLIALHGGEVAAHSDGRGHGSEFTVTLQRIEDPAKFEPSPDADGRSGPSRAILVVDDNRDAADSLAMLLAHDGHRVWVAYDGHEGVALALAHRPEVVLLDIGLPGLDGYGACRALRAAGLLDALIVATSGYGQPEDRRLSVAAGFDGFEVKPVGADALRRVIARSLPR